MMLQLNPPIPVFVVGKGAGFAVGWIDYSQEHDTLWKVIITATGEVWDVRQSQIRGELNISLGRVAATTPVKSRARPRPGRPVSRPARRKKMGAGNPSARPRNRKRPLR